VARDQCNTALARALLLVLAISSQAKALPGYRGLSSKEIRILRYLSSRILARRALLRCMSRLLGPKRLSGDVRYSAAVGGEADIRRIGQK
jgi:hypothetical protein